MQQFERSSAKKQDVDPIPRKEDEVKVSPIIVDKDCHPKDASEQPNPVAVEFKLPCDAVNAPASCKRGSHYEQHGVPPDLRSFQTVTVSGTPATK